MIFWDSSALVPVIIEEQSSEGYRKLLKRDRQPILWWQSDDEVLRALIRKHSKKELGDLPLRNAERALKLFMSGATVIAPSEPLKAMVPRIIRSHLLRTADAYQLAAALVAKEELSESILFLSADADLMIAAEREGLAVP